jgi:type IV secretory pathway VirB4 component
MAIISSTGGGKSYTMKKMIVNEYARGTKIFIFDAENEYKKIVEKIMENILIYIQKLEE